MQHAARALALSAVGRDRPEVDENVWHELVGEATSVSTPRPVPYA